MSDYIFFYFLEGKYKSFNLVALITSKNIEVAENKAKNKLVLFMKRKHNLFIVPDDLFFVSVTKI